jgi:hypothetical protein
MRLFTSLPVLLAVAVGVAAVTFVVAQLVSAGALPDGPAQPVWDADACAHCRMHLGEPAFAVQVQTTAGEVRWFDDPGCAFLHLAAAAPAVHAWYFHHLERDAWLPASATGFVPVPHSPMGFGLGAVAAEAPGALPLEEARRRVLQRGDHSDQEGR